jgi:flagellar export protein FliJ
MARYKFRLATVQKTRVVRRDQCRGALAEAFRAEQALAEQRAEVVGELADLRRMQRAAATGRYLDVNRLLEAQQYELVLRARQHELGRQEGLLAVESERRRLTLVEAEREVRAMELLDARQRSAHARRQRRRENLELDEAASVRRHRGRQGER